MCGIVGFWGIDQFAFDDKKAALQRATDALYTRGPDDGSLWCESASNVFLAHRRLSIIDTRSVGRQPMLSQNGRWAIVYNGEVYNYAELRKELESKQYEFVSETDTEVILNAIDCWGIEAAVKRFRGMFAFAINDSKTRELYLVRDRFGIKPLFFSRLNEGWAFGSQLSSLREVPGFDKTLSREAIESFILLNHVPKVQCVYQNTFKVNPGEILAFSTVSKHADPKKIVYWSTEHVVNSGLCNPYTDEKVALESVKEKLIDSVRYRMISDVPLGAFLSGGVDSSLIVSLMQSLSSSPIQTYTLGMAKKGYDEADAAGSISKHLGCRHHVYRIEESEIVKELPKMVEIYDEPFSDASQIPTYLVSKFARSDVTVTLSGDAGDEVFGGYNRYLYAQKLWDRFGGLHGGLKHGLALVLRSKLFQMGVGARNLFHSGTSKIRNSQEKLDKIARCVEAGNPLELYCLLLSQFSGSLPLLSSGESISASKLLAFPSFEENRCFLHNMMLSDTLGYLEGDILTKVDRASMAVSLEARVPYLDHELFEAAWKLPDSMRVRNGVGKWVLREILKDHIPSDLLNQQKQGFAIPIGEWMRGSIKDWMLDTLSPQVVEDVGVFDKSVVESVVRDHLKGDRNYENLIWGLMTFHRWYERNK